MLVALVKIIVAPALVGAVTFVVRRWGQAAGGWLLGLPIVSGPTSVLLCAEHGPRFARSAAQGALLGLAAGSAFCLTYALFARGRAWGRAMAAASVACAGVAWCLSEAHVGVLADAVLAAGALGATAWRLRDAPASSPQRRSSNRAVAMRMVLAAALVVAVTASASMLGSQVSGIVTPLPVISALMAASLHRRAGDWAARGLLGGVAASSWGAAVFFVVVAFFMGAMGPLRTYLVAATAALAVALVAAKVRAIG